MHQHNNLLHCEVHDFIRNIFTGNYQAHRELIISIFHDAKLTVRIVKAQRINDSIMQRPRGNRLGHMGHITLISDEIFKLLEAHGDDLKEVLKAELEHDDWHEYGELSYRETKIKDALVLGGAKAPPPPSEELMMSGGGIGNGLATFTGLFSAGTEEQLARYFCQQVIASLPNRFVFTEEGDEDGSDEDDPDYYTDHALDYDDSGHYFGNDIAPSIEIPIEGTGFDTLLEMEMRLSSLGEEDEEERSGGEEEEERGEGEGEGEEIEVGGGGEDEERASPDKERQHHNQPTSVQRDWTNDKRMRSPRVPDESTPLEKSESVPNRHEK